MKTPDEIKRGLECCDFEQWHNRECEKCPYMNADDEWCESMDEIRNDVIAYIKQLEERNAWHESNEKYLASFMQSLSKQVEQLQAERDSAVSELIGTCPVCRWEETEKCASCHFNADAWNVHESNWEWRGLPEPPKEE